MAEIMPHIKLSKEQAVPYVLLPGDPKRLDRIATCLTDTEELAYNREFRSIKGKYRGVPVMAVSTGIGGASAAIAVEELARIGVKAMIRIGSCGALQKGIRLGDFYIDEEKEICAYWAGKGVMGSDMETAALFVVGGLRGVKTASILNVVVESEESLEDNINSYTVGESAMMRGEHLEILTALEAFVRMDQG